MEEVEIKVLASELKSLEGKVVSGFADIKELIKTGGQDLNKHVEKDDERIGELETEISNLKMDMTRFKERWILLGSLGMIAIEAISHIIAK